MLKSFKAFIKEKKLFTPEENILLAVSGGVDSMVMVHLFLLSGCNISIAHLNHKLRGFESTGDEVFVRDFARDHNIQYFSKEMDMAAKAKEKKQNLQELAREERYTWFEQLCKDNDIQYIATAHHQDDEIESFIFNFSRKTGLKGLCGISHKREKIIRPLLFTNRKEIFDYAKKNKIVYREDSSNAKLKYSRNYIRHKIIPGLGELNPDFKKNAAASISMLKNTKLLFDFLLEKYTKYLLVIDGNQVRVNMEKIRSISQSRLLLYEIISSYGFNYNQAKDMIESNTTGSIFYSNNHRALLDRNEIIITDKEFVNKIMLNIVESTEVEGVGTLILNTISYPDQLEFNKNIAYLDKKLLEFPLTLRTWEPGDQFNPLGMEGTQKVKDFLINNKVDRFQKEKILVLCSGEQICWVVGWRIDDKFKLTETTERVLKVEWKTPF